MGRLSGATRAQRMSEIVWLSGADDLTIATGEAPVVWHLRLDRPETERLAGGATLFAADLQDLASKPDAGMRLCADAFQSSCWRGSLACTRMRSSLAEARSARPRSSIPRAGTSASPGDFPIA